MNTHDRLDGERRDARIAIDDLVTKKVQVAGVHPNVEQEVILVTEDKVRLCLSENFQRAARSKQWVTIAGLITTLVLTLTTAQFRDFAGLSSQEWRGVSIAVLIGSLFWFVVSLRWAMNPPTLDDIVRQLKEGSRKIATEEQVISVAGGDNVVFVGQRAIVNPSGQFYGGSWTESLALAKVPSAIPTDVALALAAARDAFMQALEWTPNAADQLLNGKDISSTARITLKLGYAPDSWDYLLKRLTGPFAVELLETAGLIHARKSGAGYYDRFRSRLMIPIAPDGKIIGFVGVSVEQVEPLLLLSPQTDYFNRAIALAYVREYPELRVITGW